MVTRSSSISTSDSGRRTLVNKRSARCDIGVAIIRPYHTNDASTLVQIAGAFAVAQWMSEDFAHPYTLTDAESWIAETQRHDPLQAWAVEVEGKLAGGVGLEPLVGSHAGGAILGYWLGIDYWGRGIATAVVHQIVMDGFATGLRRIEAHVFEQNVASARVLEKAGFRLEARLEKSYIERDGKPCDKLIYARLEVSDA